VSGTDPMPLLHDQHVREIQQPQDAGRHEHPERLPEEMETPPEETYSPGTSLDESQAPVSHQTSVQPESETFPTSRTLHYPHHYNFHNKNLKPITYPMISLPVLMKIIGHNRSILKSWYKLPPGAREPQSRCSA
jgi:hypothetical protein